MKVEELVARIEEIEEEINKDPKLEVEDMAKINPYLTLDNPLTYAVFLEVRKDLTDDEKELYKRYIKLLMDKEQTAYAKEAARMYEVQAN